MKFPPEVDKSVRGIRLAIQQPALPHYRIALFAGIAAIPKPSA